MIDNASWPGAARGDIVVRLEQCGGQALLNVANDGAPISWNERVDCSHPITARRVLRRAGGHGLGLAIIKQIANQYEATVRFATRSDCQVTVAQLAIPVLGS